MIIILKFFIVIQQDIQSTANPTIIHKPTKSSQDFSETQPVPVPKKEYPPPPSPRSLLTGVQHAREGVLLGSLDTQSPNPFDTNPHLCICAMVCSYMMSVFYPFILVTERFILTKRRLPDIGALVTLGLIDVVRHGD